MKMHKYTQNQNIAWQAVGRENIQGRGSRSLNVTRENRQTEKEMNKQKYKSTR